MSRTSPGDSKAQDNKQPIGVTTKDVLGGNLEMGEGGQGERGSGEAQGPEVVSHRGAMGLLSGWRSPGLRIGHQTPRTPTQLELGWCKTQTVAVTCREVLYAENES